MGTIDPNVSGAIQQPIPNDSSAVESAAVTQFIDDVQTTLQGDTISEADVEAIEQKAYALLSDPQLPSGDQMKLALWTGLAVAMSHGGVDGDEEAAATTGSKGVLLDETPATNPYCAPGFMATLCVILSEIGAIQKQMIKMHAELEVALMECSLQMAQESMNAAIAAGKMAAEMLEKEAEMHRNAATLALVQASMAVISAGLTAASTFARPVNREEYRQDSQGKKYWDTAPSADGKTAGVRPMGSDGKPLPEETTPPVYDDVGYTKASLLQQERRQSYIQQVGQVATQVTTAWKEMQDASLTEEKAALTEGQALQQGLQSLLDKLIQTIQQSAQGEKEAIQSAVQFWQGITQLMQSFAQLSSQFGGKG